jgi:hypothetical protein
VHLSRPRRDLVFDALRLLAVVLMVCAHTARLTATEARPAWAEPSLVLEPLCQALFVGLVGVSLALSWDAARARGVAEWPWMKGHLRRAGELMGLSVVFFLLERGPSWPHALLSTGILFIIAGAIVIFAPLVPRRGALAWSALLTFGLWGIAMAMDHRELYVLGLNAGNGPLLPTAIHAGFGLTGLLCWRRFGWKGAAGVLALATLSAVAVLGSAGSLMAALDSDWSRNSHILAFQGRGHGLQNAWDMLQGHDLHKLRASFFNPKPRMIPLVAAMVAWLYPLLLPVRHLPAAVSRWGLAMGRYALGVYVLHLGLVALPVVVSGRMQAFREPMHSNAYLLLTLALCQAYAVARTVQQRRREVARGA